MNKPKQNIFTSICYCFSLCFQSSPWLTLVRLGGRLFRTVQALVSAYLMKLLLDLLADPGSLQTHMQQLYLALGAMAGLIVLNALINKAMSYAETMQNEALQKQIMMLMMNKALGADLSFFDDSAYYDRFEKAQSDSYSLTYITWSAIDCIGALLSFVSAFIIIGRQNIWFCLIITLISIPAAFAGQRYTKALYSLETEQMNSLRKRGYLNFLATDKRFAQSVRLYQLGDYIKGRYESLWYAAYLQKKRLIRKRTAVCAVLEVLPELAMVVMSLFVVFWVINGSATVGDFSLYYGLLSQLSAAILTLISSGVQVYDNQIKVQNVRDFEEIPVTVKDEGKRTLSKVTHLELKNVSFSYPGSRAVVLDHVSFAVEDKQKVALVGVNGSGKSTLIKLLLRFYDPTEGQILINHHDIREYTLSSLRNAFGCYFQNEFNFGFTLWENIRISDWQHQPDEDRIKRALHNSTADTVLDRLKQGLDTPISRQFEEDGTELSGGQAQKVALARAFYRAENADILILDEPSSSLDPEAEQAVLDGMAKVGADKMMLFTSHQLRNVSIADKIIVLEYGRVVEIGTLSELLAQKGRFSELYHYQSDQYQTEEASCALS